MGALSSLLVTVLSRGGAAAGRFIGSLRGGTRATVGGQSGQTFRVGDQTTQVQSFVRTAGSNLAVPVAVGAATSFFIPDDLLGNLAGSIGSSNDLIPFLGGNRPTSPPSPIVKSWTAGVTPFVRLENGLVGARRKDGTWKYYRPKRPKVVLMSDGAANLKQMIRADAILTKQAQGLARMMRKRAKNMLPTRAREPRKALPPAQPGIVVVDTD